MPYHDAELHIFTDFHIVFKEFTMCKTNSVGPVMSLRDLLS